MKKHALTLHLKPLLVLQCRRWHWVIAFASAILFLSNAKSAVVLDEQFSYADGNLNGQGGWTVTGGATTAVVEAGNLDVSGLDTSSGKQIQMDGAGGTFAIANGSATLDTSTTGNGIYFSYVLHVTDGSTYDSNYEILSELAVGGNFMCVVYMKDNGGTSHNLKFGIRRAIGGTPSGSNTTPPSNSPSVFIVGKYEVNTGGNDIAKLWVNPSSASFGATEPTADIQSTSGGSDAANGTVFGGFRFTAGLGAEVDSLRIGRTWADVTPLPGSQVGQKLAFTTQPANAAPGATMSPVVVQVQSGAGGSVPSNGVPVTLSLSAGSGTLSGTLTQNTDSSGKASFGDLSINTAGTGKQLTATASGIGSGLTSANSSSFSIVVPSVGSKLAFTSQPVDTQVNSAMASVVVQIQDSNNISVSSNNVPITLTLVGSGNLGGTVTRNTDATGKATFNDLTVDTAGTGDYFTAAAGGSGTGLGGASSGTFNVTAGPPANNLRIAESSKNASGFVVKGTNNAPGAFVQILGSPNLLLDQANWLLVDYGNFDGTGAITFTNPASAALPNAFYRLRTGNTDTKIEAPGLTAINNQTVPVGATASFSTIATAPLVQYLWLFNGNPISGATTSALTIPNSQAGNAGTYTVIVANPAGSASSSASLRVGNYAPSIISGVQNVTVTSGSDALFNVIADGTAPLTYQWKDKNNAVIPGETSSTLILHSVQTNQAGTYTVSVSNGIGSPATSSATLTVNAVPTAPPDTNMVGFADVAGVTGGLGGQDVYATNYVSFSNFVRHAEALIIHVTNVITGPGPGVDPFCYIYGNNKTIIGEGTNAQVNGIDLRINATNIILANLLFQVTPVGTNDGVTIDGGSKGTGKFIWIDHCTVSNAQDGSIDVTKGADYVTVSWCKFIYGPKVAGNVHEFVHLIGSSDSDGSASQLFHVTLHHNWYGTNAMERMPSVRWGRVHVYNCFYTASGNNYCARTRIGSQVLVERNFYQGVQNPWELYTTSGTTGLLLAVGNNIPYLSTAYGNHWVSGWTSGASTIPGTNSLSDFTPVPYAYTPNDASDVPYYVQTYSGHGKYPYVP
jgi:pectate lyase